MRRWLGENNFDVLRKNLGYTEDKISELYDNNVLYHEVAVNRLKP